MNTISPTATRGIRFDLRSLLALVALLAFGLTALKLATHGWAIAMTTLTATMLLFAVLRWFHTRDSTRAFWSGFALCGAGYLATLWILSIQQPRTVVYAPTYAPGISTSKKLEDDLATSEFLDFLFRKFNPAVEEAYPTATNISVFDAPTSLPPAAWYGPAVYAYPPVYTAPTVSSSPVPVSVVPSSTNDSGASATEPSPANAGSHPIAPDAATVPSVSSAPSDDGTPPAAIPPSAATPPLYYPAPAAPVPTYPPPPSVASLGYDPQVLYTRLTYFPRIGHCLFALVIGWIGGCIASGFARPAALSRDNG